MIYINALQQTDLDVVSTFQPSGWPDIMPSIRFYLETPFCFPLKVTYNNLIAGIGTGIEHNGSGWLAHIIVHPDYRNKGIGTIITKTLMDNFKAKGISSLYLLASDLGERVYEKLGFVTQSQYLLFKDITPFSNASPPPNIIPASANHIAQIAELDKQASGEDRMLHLQLFLKGGYVYLSDNIVNGFYLPGWGEGLIIANNSSAGIALMQLRLATKNYAAFPSENKDAIAFMHQIGSSPFQSVKRMCFGPSMPWQPQYLYNRIRGNLG
ncbi:hypothetical protein DJ568_07525 [Mucilaginibacter hurinus]|uniref:N-acetyltransferase domain-containing protein n=1 Tax=Mucilaginibacter hurinus TaxID=2201324 RepID=A0A367GSC1_9SPHI|nr:GNAT family N-acetyltransferase [Mucilaginibacter hurinus]RCH55726.1 hypothetical protein DJ568_07525 [Mucilaginibacter hurinus]